MISTFPQHLRSFVRVALRSDSALPSRYRTSVEAPNEPRCGYRHLTSSESMARRSACPSGVTKQALVDSNTFERGAPFFAAHRFGSACLAWAPAQSHRPSDSSSRHGALPQSGRSLRTAPADSGCWPNSACPAPPFPVPVPVRAWRPTRPIPAWHRACGPAVVGRRPSAGASRLPRRPKWRVPEDPVSFPFRSRGAAADDQGKVQ
jgi:hypothetical protein